MKKYDFRFDRTLIKTFIGRNLSKIKQAEFLYTNSVTGIIGFQVESEVFELTNEYVKVDFLTLDGEATIFRISKSDWNRVESMIINDINEIDINEEIKKVILVNDHTTLKIDNNVCYDMWDTKAIIFYFKDFEICFEKQDCWFSQEIEVYKGYNLLEKIGDGKGILDDFDDDCSKIVNVERTFDEVR